MALWLGLWMLPLLVGGATVLLLPARHRALPGYVGVVATLLSWVGSLGLVLALGLYPPAWVAEATWLHFPTVGAFTVGAYLDTASLLLVLAVCTVALLVQVFSVWYRRGQAHGRRYVSLLLLFQLAMLCLVVAPNLLQLFVAWELVGACSYLLIGFDTHNPKAARAATQAFWVNRVADVALIAALGLLWAQYQSLSFSTLLASGQPAPSVWVGALLLVGAMGKSAQIPFQGWLPDAMTGPTPVSALIHAATMVAAGVFLLVRAYPLLAPPVLLAATVVGVLTAVVGSVLALRQWELKRVLAFSTVAQLGYMVAAVGLGAPHLALLHLLTHAAFKAGLFLVAGSVQHAVHVAADGLGVSHAEGDLRALGGLWRQLPITFAVASVAIAALVGLPLTAGFLSKDAILLQALWVAPAAGALLVFAAALTAYYSLRWLAMVFLGPPRMPKPLAAQVREASGWQRAPLVLLGVASLALLYVPLAGLVGLRPPAMAEGHALVLEGWLWATLGFGQLVAALLVYRAYRTGALWQGAGLVFELGFPTLYRWLFGAISGLSRLAGGVERYVVGGLLAVVQRVVVGFRPLHAELSLRTLADGIDRRVVDPAVNALAEGLLRSGRRLGVLQRGRVQRYLAYTLVGLVLVVALVLGWRSGQSFAPLLPN